MNLQITSYIIQLQSILKWPKATAIVDTVNGNALEPFEIELTICDSFMRKGDWLMRNAYINETPVVIQDKQYVGYHIAPLYFEPHYSGMRTKAIDWLEQEVALKTNWNINQIQVQINAMPTEEDGRRFLENVLILAGCKVNY